jgi:hypothetical protein
VIRIISGGQTGVDRGALDAALDADWPCGGYCPEGRLAEDGIIPDRYPLEELPGKDYLERTIRNLQEAGGTIIIYFGSLSGGTEKTLFECIAQERPYLLIDAQEVAVGQAAHRIQAFVQAHQLGSLNIAGPRASHEPEARNYAYLAVSSWIRMNEIESSTA